MTSGHTCEVPADGAEAIDAVSYDLRCEACIAMRIAAEGPFVPVAPAVLPFSRERIETALRDLVLEDESDRPFLVLAVQELIEEALSERGAK